MGKYRSRLLFLVTIGIMSVFISVPVAGAGICDDTNAPPNTCFTTPSGWVFRTADIINPPTGIPCADQNGVIRTVKNFPERIQNGWAPGVDSNLWCYQLEHDPSISSRQSVNAINLQVALPYFTTQPTPNINMQSPGKVFQFNEINGCLGDTTTGFEVGDLEACGLKVEFQSAIKTTAAPATRLSFATKAVDPLNNLGVGPVIIAPRIGSALEPGFINGPDGSSAFSAAGLPDSTCQVVNGFVLKFFKNDSGCTESVYVCSSENSKCSNPGTTLATEPFEGDVGELTGNICYPLEKKTAKLTLRNLYSGNFITPVGQDYPIPISLKEIGFVGGKNSCGEGIATGIGSCSVWIQTGSTTGYYITTNVAGTSNTTCRLPAKPQPLFIRAGGITPTSITINWRDESTTEDGFKVARTSAAATGSSCQSTYSNIYTVDNPIQTPAYSAKKTPEIPEFTYTNTGLTSGKCYCYKVRGYLKGGGLDGGMGAINVICATTQ